jgi:O-antigen/teichoic acid export membrane protein
MGLRDSFLKNNFLKDVTTLFSGSAITQLIGFLFLPFLTRLFLPEEFGVFYLFLTTASIISMITTGGYEKAFVIPESDRHAEQLLLFALMLSAGVTVFSFIILIFLNQWGDSFFQTKHSRLILWLMPVYSLLFGVIRIFQNWSIRIKRYRWLSQSNVIRSGSLSGIQTAFGIFHTGSFGLVMGACLGQLFPLWFLFRRGGENVGRITMSKLKEAWLRGKEYISYPVYKMPSDLLNEVSIQLPVYVFMSVFSKAVVGIYTLPQKIISQPSKFIGQAVAEVYYRQASELNARKQDISDLTFRTYKNLFILGVIPFLAVMLWGQEIFSFVFGNEWAESGRIASILSPWLLFVFAGSPVSYTFLIRQKLRLSFLMNLLLLFIRLAALLTGALILKDLLCTIILFAGCSFIYWIFITFYSLHLGGVKIWRAIFFTIITIIVTGAPLVLIKLLLL